jgi:hypothetical protein
MGRCVLEPPETFHYNATNVLLPSKSLFESVLIELLSSSVNKFFKVGKAIPTRSLAIIRYPLWILCDKALLNIQVSVTVTSSVDVAACTTTGSSIVNSVGSSRGSNLAPQSGYLVYMPLTLLIPSITTPWLFCFLPNPCLNLYCLSYSQRR